MKQSLLFQVGFLIVLSLVLAVANNLRPKAAIEWIRDWPSFSQLAESQIEEKEEGAGAGDVPSQDPAVLAGETGEFVVGNVGITDIGLETAARIHRYAKDFTLWIDARSPDLYEEGHIQGAHLLHLYEKNDYLPQVEAAIQENQPAALVIYCKGKDCTDSHHLAQDLAALGYANIFVFKDGFDDWFEAELPIEGALAAQNEAGISGDAAEAGTVIETVVSNVGITDIGLEQATKFFRYAQDFTLWIDARSPDLYEEGHIQGAHLLHLYEKNEYLPDVQALIEERQPDALIIYCKGKDCTDSHHLAQDLSALGYANIFVYKDGFDAWHQAGQPIEGRLAVTELSPRDAGTQLTVEAKPPGMYLEHIVRDLAPFLFGVILLFSWKRARDSRAWLWSASIFAGLFFLYAAWPKIANPFLFAKNIWNYDIAPAAIINFSALLLPMLELTAGIGLITGFFRRGSGFIVSILLVIFIFAVSFNVLRGHEFNCGCTSDKPFFPELYLSGWSDKITLLLRDVGLLAMAWLAYRTKKVPHA